MFQIKVSYHHKFHVIQYLFYIQECREMDALQTEIDVKSKDVYIESISTKIKFARQISM
jgi:hypothetical protein